MQRIYPSRLTILSFFLSIWLALPNAIAQQPGKGTIQGHVQTSDGQPAGNVSVSLKGTTFGTNTDGNGRFSLRVPAGDYILVTSVVGFASKEQNVNIRAGEVTQVGTVTISETAQELSEVVISARNSGSYRENMSALATRTPTPLRDIPQSIQVINRQLIEDRGVMTVAEALRTTAGINGFSSSQYSDYVLRGFRSTAGNFAYNGIRGDFYQFDQAALIYNIEQIEAVKGPASVLFSAGNPGGVINHVTKRARPEARYDAWFTVGSFGQYIGSADATGSLSRNKKLLYRLIAGYENAGQLDRNQHIENIFLAPQLEYRFSDKTRLNYELNYSNDHRTMGFQRGVPALFMGEGKWQLDYFPANFSMIDPRGYSRTRAVSNQLTFGHSFFERVQLHVWLRSMHTRQRQFDVTPTDFNIGAVNDSINMENRLWRPDYAAYQASAFLNWNFNIATVGNQLTLGADYTHDGRVVSGYATIASAKVYLPYPDFSWATYDDSDASLQKAIKDSNYVAKWTERTRLASVYFQNQITFSPKWKALIGARAEQHGYINRYADILTDKTTDQDTLRAFAFSPRAGLVFQPSKMLSFYASYTQGFQPQYASVNQFGTRTPPERSRQYEVGAKTDWLGGKLNASAALYYIQKYDVLVTDPSNQTRAIQLDNVTSKGVELSVQGNLITHLSLIANYAYNEAITPPEASNGGFDGNPTGWFPNAPNHNANFWATYRVAHGSLQGLQFGAGGNYLSKRTTFVAGFEVPGYTTFDGLLGYQRNGLRVNLNVYNLLNVRYWQGVYGPANLWPGNPRSFRLTVGYTIGK